jgi:hypothetical protein
MTEPRGVGNAGDSVNFDGRVSMTQGVSSRSVGYAMMALGIYLNIPFAVLGWIFAYPQVLREPAGTILARFHAGGTLLLAVWYAFVLAALALVPLAFMARRLGTSSWSAGAAIAGVLGGVFQAIGLIRWVFVVPILAEHYMAPDATAATRETITVAFTTLHAYAGVAIGEHLGQLATAAWALLLSASLKNSGRIPRWQNHIAQIAAALILVGLVEGFATVRPFDPGLAAIATPWGFIALSVWMVIAGFTLTRRQVHDPRRG